MTEIHRIGNPQRERTMEEFVKELRVSGRYFVGNPSRQKYLQDHKPELDRYLDTLRTENWRDADHLESLIKANSKPQPKRQLELYEMMEARGNLLNRSPKTKEEKITRYNPAIRKRVEKYIFSGILLAAIPVAAHIGLKYVDRIEKTILPYTQKIFQLYDEIDNKR